MVSSLNFIEPVDETGHVCAQCGRALLLGDEAVIVTVVEPGVIQRRNDAGMLENVIDSSPVLADTSDEEFAYEPYLLHRECWVEVEADWENQISKEKPVTDERKLMECDICTSSILVGETSGRLQVGKLAVSNRRPHNMASLVLAKSADDRYVCVVCLAGINAEFLEMWEDGVTHDAACEIGVRNRCWRTGCEHSCKYDDLYCPNCQSTNVDLKDVGGTQYVCGACNWVGPQALQMIKPDDEDEEEEN